MAMKVTALEPHGSPFRCHVCGHVTYSQRSFYGDTTCAICGALLWHKPIKRRPKSRPSKRVNKGLKPYKRETDAKARSMEELTEFVRVDVGFAEPGPVGKFICWIFEAIASLFSKHRKRMTWDEIRAADEETRSHMEDLKNRLDLIERVLTPDELSDPLSICDRGRIADIADQTELDDHEVIGALKSLRDIDGLLNQMGYSARNKQKRRTKKQDSSTT